MENLILLHGALGSKNDFGFLEELLSRDYILYSMNFNGHGGAAAVAETFTLTQFRDDVIAYMDARGITHAYIFGYSMGGYVALKTAIDFPERIKGVFTLATMFDWTPDSAVREADKLDAEILALKVPDYVQFLKDTHGEHDWLNVVRKTALFMKSLPERGLFEKDYNRIKCPVRLSVGDRDKMVSLSSNHQVMRMISNASMLVIPDTPHVLSKVNPFRIQFELNQFFSK